MGGRRAGGFPRPLALVAAALLLVVAHSGAASAQLGASPPGWLSLFKARNNVTVDQATGAVRLQGWTSGAGSLAPSAGLLSLNAFDGDVSINVTVSDYQIVQSGYQAQISLFFAPLNYTLADYTSWPATDTMSSQQQLGWMRVKVYPTITDYTFGSSYAAANATSGGFGSPAMLGLSGTQGVLSLRRSGGKLSGSLKVGSKTPVAVPSAPMASGPLLVGVQVLYGYNFSVGISSISIAADTVVAPPSPPPPPPSPPPPPPPQPTWTVSANNTLSALFSTRNNVTVDQATGAVRLQGWTSGAGSLAPSAGLLSLGAFDGDVSINVTVSDYQIVQSGYQAQICLFFAPLEYDLGDYLSWPDGYPLDTQQAAYLRAKVFATITDYTFATIHTAANGTWQDLGSAGRLSADLPGTLSLRRRNGQVSGVLQVGSAAPYVTPPLPVASGPLRVGVQVLYGFNYSLALSRVAVAYDTAVVANRPPPSPPSPPPPPPPPPPPSCAVSPAPPVVYPGGYEPKGVGGGGAMSCFSTSPYSDLWLVGTDMGTLYRSPDAGATWQAIAHTEMRMTTDMPFAPPVGFSSDGHTLFFAPCWTPPSNSPCVAKRSSDAGVTWQPMDVNAGGETVYNRPGAPPNNKRPIRYWACSSTDPDLCFAATTAGLDRTADRGATWRPVADAQGALAADSRGTFLDASTSPPTVYHATPSGVFSWPDGAPDNLTAVLRGAVRSFAAGRGAGGGGLTLAYVDANGSFCAEALAGVDLGGEQARNATLQSCGRLWVSRDGGATWQGTAQYAAKVVMAENEPRVLYTHGSRSWSRNYGVRVWKTTLGADGAATTAKVFDQVNFDDRYALWPPEKLEYSAVGLDVGYWDGGYYLFSVNQLNANLAGGSENFFLHVTRDGGQTWTSPFTRFRDCGARAAGKRWSSAGLEPTNWYTVVPHPSAPGVLYAGAADIRGMASEDGGDTWRLIGRGAAPNSIYGFAFDAERPSRVFAATAKWHDFPQMWYASPLNGNGGIFLSEDAGRTWARAGGRSTAQCLAANASSTPCADDMVNEFLAVARDSEGGWLYGGGHINGIARLRAGSDAALLGGTWEWCNFNLLGEDLRASEAIVPRIQIDPVNGDVYALLTGMRTYDARHMLNQPRTGVYVMPRNGTQWRLLRGEVHMPPAFASVKPWYYPTGFAVDWTSGEPGARSRLLLVDFQNNGQPPGSVGVWKTNDGGANWHFKQQADWAVSVSFDAAHPGRAYVSGSRSSSPWGLSTPGTWGYGGAFYSNDWGETWQEDPVPFQDGTNMATPDPADLCKVYYATSGAGVVRGPAPPGLAGC